MTSDNSATAVGKRCLNVLHGENLRRDPQFAPPQTRRIARLPSPRGANKALGSFRIRALRGDPIDQSVGLEHYFDTPD